MNSTLRTGTYVVVALVLTALWYVSAPEIGEPELFDDQGEEFFPAFEDPTAAAALEVVAYDPATAELSPFRVEVKDGRWTIPSHHGYPADAKERMAESAGMLVGLRKAAVRSDDADDHSLFGVLDPTEPGLAEDGFGTLVRFEDTSGNDLAALIIGKEVEGKPEMRYVRVPGRKRTYVATLPTIPSTDFADWIETDLLDVSSYDVDQLVFDNYSIDEATFSRVRGDRVVASQEDGKWTIEGLADGETADEDALRDVTAALADLKIVGVRAKPEGLTGSLARSDELDVSPTAVLSLQSRGFFLAGDGQLYANEGDLLAQTNQGIVYTLRFGEVLYGSGATITAGAGGAEPAGENEAAPPAEAEADAHRYLMVTAAFDPQRLPDPEGDPLAQEELDRRQQAREGIERVADALAAWKSAHEGALPESLTALTEGEDPLLESLAKDPWGNDYVLQPGDDTFVVKSLGADGAEGGEGAAADVAADAWDREEEFRAVARQHEEHATKVEEAKATAKRLSERFAPWYYVIDDERFAKLHRSRADLVAEAEPAEPADATDAADGEADHDHEPAEDDGEEPQDGAPPKDG